MNRAHVWNNKMINAVAAGDLEKNQKEGTAQDDPGECLRLASMFGNLHAMRRLVDRGANPLGIGCEWLAAESGHLEIVQYLAELGANFHTCKGQFECAASLAAANGHLGVVRYLAAIGVDVGIDRDGVEHDHCLLSAYENNRTSIVKFLTSLGVYSFSLVEAFDYTGIESAQWNLHAARLVHFRYDHMLRGTREYFVARERETRARAARVVYSAVLAGWIPRCYDRRRRAGRRMGRRNLAAFRRLCVN